MATPQDAELILKLYDLRREPVLRDARNFMLGTFWPESVDEFLVVFRDFGGQNNAYLRQFNGYWEMAVMLVLHGALDAALFCETSNEMFFVFAKVQPLSADIKLQTGLVWMPRTAELIERFPVAKQRLEFVSKRVEERRTQRSLAPKLDL